MTTQAPPRPRTPASRPKPTPTPKPTPAKARARTPAPARTPRPRPTTSHGSRTGQPRRARSAPAPGRTTKPRNPRPTSARRPAGASPRRRLIALLVVMVLGGSLVVVRLTQIQVLSADRYVAFGESQRVRQINLPAERGAIFDRNGRELALSVPRTTVGQPPPGHRPAGRRHRAGARSSTWTWSTSRTC